MALTPSTMIALGTPAYHFQLEDTDGKIISSKEYAKDKPLLIMFICNHCPYVKHIRNELAKLGLEYAQKGVSILAVNSNDVENYPEDSPEKMQVEKKNAGYTFPYLFDSTQNVAKAYRAACTPDFFLFDRKHLLVYRGQLDDSRPGNGNPVTGKDLRFALDAVLTGIPISLEQKPSVGCNIKWK